jgi:hypothetical protein
MIKESKVLVKINLRNSTHYKNYGYDISEKELLVNIDELSKNSKIRVTAICEICESENKLTYAKYNVNRNRNNKGYYSCFDCKNIEKEKTCIEKYGVKSYSMTDEFKLTESVKWKGIKKGGDKGKLTMIERYGVDSYFKTDESKEYNRKWMSSDEFKIKSKNTLQEKWGVDSYSKTDEFKKDIYGKKDIIIEKIKNKFLDIYGVDSYSKTDEFKNKMFKNKDEIVNRIKSTCVERYGVDNVSKLNTVQNSIRKTKESRNIIIPDILLSDWNLYKRQVRKLTNRVKFKLYENWDGYDYYDNELIKDYLSHTHTHRFYPTIDHKISVYFGFISNINPKEIGSLDNLCITKRFINSIKGRLIENDFNL